MVANGACSRRMSFSPAGSSVKARPRFLYLHGFASSPASRKALFFASRLQEEGVGVEIPALDGGDFASLTVTAQLKTIATLAGENPVVLIGSSMGGYLAALHAARNPRVERMVLLAPAFGFLNLWRKRLGSEGLARWRKDGSMPVFHYGLGRETPLRYELMEDAEKYELEPAFAAPAVIFHGNRDEVVPVESSVQYVRRHSNVELVRMDAGHELTDVLEPVWLRSKAFLQSVLAGF